MFSSFFDIFWFLAVLNSSIGDKMYILRFYMFTVSHVGHSLLESHQVALYLPAAVRCNTSIPKKTAGGDDGLPHAHPNPGGEQERYLLS